jgi:hypothetical protein
MERSSCGKVTASLTFSSCKQTEFHSIHPDPALNPASQMPIVDAIPEA